MDRNQTGSNSKRSALGTSLQALAVIVAASSIQATEAAGQGSAPQAGQEVILVTGSTDGLGREVARRLGADGAHVIIHGRNRERGLAVVEEIEQGGGTARFYAADFGSVDQVRDFAETILEDYDRLDVLVNNAGIWVDDPERQLSDDGHELHFAVNYLSGFQLTHLLLPRLIESAPARIVNVASAAQQPIDFDDVMLTAGYDDSRAYAQSKLAQVMFTMDLAEELEGEGVAVNSLHPATLMNTTLVREIGVEPRSTVEEGAEAVVNLVRSEEVGTGEYYNGLRQARPDDQAFDEAARERLRELSRELTGIQ
ncbi:MAG: SDR family NAD(P)-dependent oxidoreductase [Gemmatimonas sp.]|nr:SDR family NAD(P)-dependent oxidoreductase [Gemmatimonas sp.]